MAGVVADMALLLLRYEADCLSSQHRKQPYNLNDTPLSMRSLYRASGLVLGRGAASGVPVCPDDSKTKLPAIGWSKRRTAGVGRDIAFV